MTTRREKLLMQYFPRELTSLVIEYTIANNHEIVYDPISQLRKTWIGNELMYIRLNRGLCPSNAQGYAKYHASGILDNMSRFEKAYVMLNLAQYFFAPSTAEVLRIYERLEKYALTNTFNSLQGYRPRIYAEDAVDSRR